LWRAAVIAVVQIAAHLVYGIDRAQQRRGIEVLWRQLFPFRVGDADRRTRPHFVMGSTRRCIHFASLVVALDRRGQTVLFPTHRSTVKQPQPSLSSGLLAVRGGPSARNVPGPLSGRHDYKRRSTSRDPRRTRTISMPSPSGK